MQEFMRRVGGPNLKEAASEATKEISSIEEGGEEENGEETKTAAKKCVKSFQFYGSDGVKDTLYPDGIPELLGRKTVERLFQGENIVSFCANQLKLQYSGSIT